jgi:hypothetical protein
VANVAFVEPDRIEMEAMRRGDREAAMARLVPADRRHAGHQLARNQSH